MPADAFNIWADEARAVPLERVLEQRGLLKTLRREGKEFVGPCPVCGDGDDRFSVNPAEQLFNCRICGTGGQGAIDLCMFLDGSDFDHAAIKLTGKPRPNGKQYYSKSKQVTVATYSYCDEMGAVVYEIDRIEFQTARDKWELTKDGKRRKVFYPRRPDPDHPGRWINKLDGVARIPYRLPELFEAVIMQRLLYIVEGEACVEALRDIAANATTNPGGAGKWLPEMSECLRGADVVLVPDNDDVGYEHINKIGASLVGVAARTRVLVLPELPPKGDVCDWLAAGGTREQLDALTEAAPEWLPPLPEPPADEGTKAKANTSEQELIDALARLNPPDYDRRRDESADQLGIRRGTLDNEVERRRREMAEDSGPAPLFGHWLVEPWPEAVDAGGLIFTLIGRIQRHAVVNDDQALTIALWILFAWVHDIAAVHSPILLVTSAEANSGKTQLLSVVSYLAPRALPCVEISEATLFRGVELWLPTLLVDEADSILVNNEPLRAIVNSGWTRGSCVPRCIGDEKTPHAFPTFCPKAIGMKGRKLPDTTLSRSIIIQMRRKKPGENIPAHFRSIDDAGLAELRRRAMRWAVDNGEKLEDAEPVMPPGFDNRLGDNWHLLLAIADSAGDEWPTKARAAAIKLSKVVDVASIGVQLLAAVKEAFDGDGQCEPRERLSSAELAAAVGEDASSPFSEWKGGKPITPAQLARVLKPFGIAPEGIRLPAGKTPRGYLRSQFEDAWERYLTS